MPSVEAPIASDTRSLEGVVTQARVGIIAASRSSLSEWARRALLQSELATARELAGLPDEELTRLENEFSADRAPPRPPWQRNALPLGIAVLLLASLALAAPEHVGGFGDLDVKLMRLGGAALLLMGVLAISARYVASLASVPHDRAYRTVGLYVSELDDRHPWLYETLGITRHQAADEYRRKVLQERGLLRGADYVLMCEIVRVHDALDRARPTSSVVEALQLLPVPAPPADDTEEAERRLVPIAAGRRG